MRWCWCPDWSLTVRGTGTGMAAVIMTAILQGFLKLSRMAVAFEGQIEEQLAVLPTDVRMHRIYTEEREYRI